MAWESSSWTLVVEVEKVHPRERFTAHLRGLDPVLYQMHAQEVTTRLIQRQPAQPWAKVEDMTTVRAQDANPRAATAL